MTSDKSKRSSPEEALARGRTMAGIVEATLDKLPGLGEALPALPQLAQGLRERGLAALNDQPLPSLAQIRSAVQALPLAAAGPLLEARVLMLSRLDRRQVRRPSPLRPSPADAGIETQDMALSEFFEVSGMPIPAWLADELAGRAPSNSAAPPAPVAAAAPQAQTGGERRARPRPAGSRTHPGQEDVFVAEVSMDDFMAEMTRQKASG